MPSRWLWVILAGALAVRAGLWVAALPRPERYRTPDSRGYTLLARRLAAGQGFTRPAERDGAPRPEIFRTPGYPVFLLLATAGGELGPAAATGVQVLLDVGLVTLTFLLGRELLGRRVGLLAAALQAVAPVAVAASCRVLSDSLYALLLTAAVLLLVRAVRDGRWRAVLAAGLVLAAACYVRPVGLSAVACGAGVLAFRRGGLRQAAALVGIVAACVAPWVLRNGLTADYWGFSSFATDSLYAYAAPQTLAAAQGIPEADARRRLQRDMERAGADEPEPTPGELARRRQRAALDVLREHPGVCARLHLGGCVGFWLPGSAGVLETVGLTTGQRGTLKVLREEGLWAAVRHYFGGAGGAWALGLALALVTLAIYAGAALCLAGGARRRPGLPAVLLLVLIVVSSLLGGTASTPRFRAPVQPLLAMAAACGWAWLAGRRARRASRGRR